MANLHHSTTIKTKLFIAVTILLMLPMFAKAISDYRGELEEVTIRIRSQMETIIKINTATNQNFMWSRAAVRDRLGEHFDKLPVKIQHKIINVGADGLDATMANLNEQLSDTIIWYSWGSKILKYVESQGDEFNYRQLPKDNIDKQVLATGEAFYGIVNWDGDESIYKKGTQVFRAAFPVKIIEKKDVKVRDKTIHYISACASCHINDMGISPMDPMAVVSVAFDMEHTLAAAKTKMIKSILISMLFNIITLVVLFYILQSQMFTPLAELQNQINDMAEGEGDLTKRLTVKRIDEVGNLSLKFNHFVENIQNVIMEVDETSKTLAVSSEELFATSSEIEKTTSEVNRGIEESNDNLQHTSTNIKQLVDSIKGINQSISDVQGNAQEAEQKAQEGTASVAATNNSIQKIEESSKKMLGIMDVISEISKQTNLLSLNAAIEAAKAGEFGKGFAVVADEVRNLSERSSSATEKIQRLIEISYANVYEGITVIEKTGVTLKGIIGLVNQIYSQINGIAGQMGDQERRTNEIAGFADQISLNSGANAVAMNELNSTMAEVDSTTEDLSKLAEKLRDQVSTFKIE
ncbi:MAG: methyl-accepting chemotaxis protein [SAR324 cluster bacterium]|nr:methyl-accepting chemotaxis protein [SAR324 cluster bacterium]